MVTINLIKIKLGIDNTIYYIIIFLKAISLVTVIRWNKRWITPSLEFDFLYFVLNIYIPRVANLFGTSEFFLGCYDRPKKNLLINDGIN